MEKPLGYKEKELLNDYKDDFAFEIRKRGSDYYYSNHVISVFKCKNKYIAKVSGSNIIGKTDTILDKAISNIKTSAKYSVIAQYDKDNCITKIIVKAQ